MTSKQEEETTKGGYTFVVLDDYLDNEDTRTQDKKYIKDEDSNSSSVINFSLDFAPDFENIIHDDYYLLDNTKDSNDDKNEYFNKVGDEEETEIVFESEYDNVSNNNSLLHTNSTTLNQKLLNINSNNNSTKNKKRTIAATSNILSKLYWKQWKLKTKFKKHIYLSDWWSYPIYKKFLFSIDFLITLARDLTIPTLDKENWSKSYAVLQPIASSLFIVFLFGNMDKSIENVPIPLITFLCSLLPSFFIFLFTHEKKPPENKLVTVFWSLWAFTMCIFWTYMIAGELIICLSSAGDFLKLSASFLGLTVLAWGNSIGDFFTITSLAKLKYGEMAVAGCYGGPVFNILMGLGVSLVYCSIKTYPKPFKVTLDTSSKLSLLFLYISLLSTMIIVSLKRFKIDKIFGYYLVFLYTVYTICQVILLLVNN